MVADAMVPGPAARWDLLVDRMPDAISVHDAEGTYLYTSSTFTDLFGWTSEQLVGRDPYLLFHPDDVPDIQTAHAATLDGRGRTSVQYRLRCADGSYQWVETTTGTDPDGRIVAITRPINDRRSLLHALDNERMIAERLREIERERQAFLTAIAHRSRHPITALLGFASLLHAGRVRDPDALQNIYGRLVDNAERLAELVEVATTADELSRQARSLRRGPVDLARLARDIAADFWDLEHPDQTTVTFDLASPAVVFADRERLAVAIRALYQNAIKHTPVGTSIDIAARAHPDGMLFLVEDDGPGVPDTRKTTIFDRLAHGDPRGTHPDPGLGLGLYLVNQITHAHGGTAWVEDRNGGGASFRILLPTTDPTATPRDR